MDAIVKIAILVLFPISYGATTVASLYYVIMPPLVRTRAGHDLYLRLRGIAVSACQIRQPQFKFSHTDAFVACQEMH